MKKLNNQLDEMQESQLRKVESTGCKIAYWGLFIAIMVQTQLGNNPASCAGEMIIFLILSVYLSVASIRRNIWDRRLKPDFKTNLILTVSASTAVAGLVCVRNYLKYGMAEDIGIVFLFTFLSMAVLIGAYLAISSYFFKKRIEKAEAEMDKEE